MTMTAEFWHASVDALNCTKYEKNLLKSGHSASTARASRLKEFYCDQLFPAHTGRVYVIDGIEFRTCLCNFKHPLTNSYFELSGLLEKGVLPDRGPYLDQAAKTVEAIRLVKHLQLDYQIQQQEREQKDKKRGR